MNVIFPLLASVAFSARVIAGQVVSLLGVATCREGFDDASERFKNKVFRGDTLFYPSHEFIQLVLGRI
jgi:hypothetical protein